MLMFGRSVVAPGTTRHLLARVARAQRFVRADAHRHGVGAESRQFDERLAELERQVGPGGTDPGLVALATLRHPLDGAGLPLPPTTA